MSEEKIKNFLFIFASEVLRDVAVQTHTDWEKHLNPIIDKYVNRGLKELCPKKKLSATKK